MYSSVKLSFLKRVSFLLNIVLLVSIIFDPYNVIFHVKNLAFVLFVLTSLPFINFRYFYVQLIFLTVFFLSLSFGLITEQNLSSESTMSMLKSFLFLLYILWMPCEYLKTFKIFYYICFLLAILQVVLFVLLLCFSDLIAAFTLVINQGDDSTLLIGMRDSYGLVLPMVFYKTSPLLVLPLGFAIADFLENKTIKKFFFFAVFCLGFFVSGTRADMLSCIVLPVGVYLFYCFYNKKRFFFTAISLSVVFISFLAVTVFLLTAENTSTEIKAGHLVSFMKLFEENPIKFLLIGNGPVSYMYSSGFGKQVTLTELTYLEMIKNFGLIQTIFLVCVLLLPVYFIAKNSAYKKLQKFSLSLSYIAYLFIAGTNPLLITSTGFTAVAIAFSLGSSDVFSFFHHKKDKSFVKNYFLKVNDTRSL